MSDRRDITVFGATGFTGKLTAIYLAEHAPVGLRIATAGRNRGKLAEIAAEIARKTGRTVEIVEASVDDPASLHAMATNTRVVLTTVGPFAKYGVPVVDAAIACGADYVDSTGEPAFVGEVLRDFDARARAQKVRVVNCCGLDVIPHDLGVLYTVDRLDKSQPISVEGFVQAKGGASGGTWHSLVNGLSDLRGSRAAMRSLRVESPRVRSTKLRVRYEPAVKGWVAPMPTIDPLMVLRSAETLDYGPGFRYGHYLRVGSVATLAGLGIGLGAVTLLAQLPPTKKLLLKWKTPGEGPSEEERAAAWFKVTFVGTDGKKRVVTRVSGGDPGYGETAKMLSETALALVLDRDKLPNRYGVLTPAAATEHVLLDRLNRAGIPFETLEG